MRHQQRPCRCPLRPERAALALWATPVHPSSMVESTADDHLTVDGDAMFVVSERRCDAACTSLPERRRPSQREVTTRRT